MANYQHKLTDTLKFGKYRGKTLEWVLEHDVEYIEWAREEIEWFDIDEEAEEMYEDALWDSANNSPPEEYYWQPG